MIQNPLVNQQVQDIVNGITKIAHQHLQIAYKAKMTHYEMSRCIEISNLQNVPIDQIFNKMAVFKESSDYIVYKKDFVWNDSQRDH